MDEDEFEWDDDRGLAVGGRIVAIETGDGPAFAHLDCGAVVRLEEYLGQGVTKH